MSSRHFAWFKYAGGLGLGLYLAGFVGLNDSGFLLPVQLPPWRWLLICLGAGLVAAFISHGISLWFLQRYCGMEKSRAVRAAAFFDLAWMVLPLGLLFYPVMLHVGSTLQMDVLGKIFILATNQYIQLPAGGYLYLLWAGPWILLPVFLKAVYGVRFYLHYYSSRKIEPPVNILRLFFMAVLFYGLLGAWATTIYPPTGDEPHYLLIAESLIHDHDIDLQNNMLNKDFRKFYPGQELDFHGIALAGKPGISKHFPALPLLLAPLYALLGLGGAVLFMILTASGITVCLYGLARQWGQSRQEALLVWLVGMLSVPLGVYYNLIYPELPAVLLLLLGLLSWRRGGEAGIWGLVLAVAVLPWLYPKYIPQTLVLFVLFLMMPGVFTKHRIMPGLVLLTSGALYGMFYFNFYGFGISGNPYGTLAWPVSWQGLRNALGLLVDRDFGIVATAPFFLLSVLGWYQFKREQKRIAIVLAIIFITQYLLYTVFDDFTGSAAVFSRQMLLGCLPLLPLVMPGWTLAKKNGGWVKTTAVFLIGVSMFLAWITTAWPFLRYLSPKLVLWEKIGFVPSVFPSMIVDPGWQEIIWAGVWVIIFVIFFRYASPRNDR
ncbi:hypothetical protein K8S19_01055 [bacterium]|nr:hypothetical protein [bacterium]